MYVCIYIYMYIYIYVYIYIYIYIGMSVEFVSQIWVFSLFDNIIYIHYAMPPGLWKGYSLYHQPYLFIGFSGASRNVT